MSDFTRRRNIEIGRDIVQAAPQLYVDLDVEADGVPGLGSLLSIGVVSPFGETFYRELRPSSEEWLERNKKFCDDHNLDRGRLCEEGIEPKQAMEELAEWDAELRARHSKSSSVLSAFNASFDFPWIDLEMKRAKVPSPYGEAGYCIKSLAAALQLPMYDWGKTSKKQLPEDILPEGDLTHNALEDAIYQQKLHFALIGELSRR
jgi:hypothetical protein